MCERIGVLLGTSELAHPETRFKKKKKKRYNAKHKSDTWRTGPTPSLLSGVEEGRWKKTDEVRDGWMKEVAQVGVPHHQSTKL